MNASYFDGRSAERQAAELSVSGAALVLTTAAGITHWAFASLQQIEEGSAGPLRIRSLDHADALVVVDDRAAFAALDPRLAHLLAPPFRYRTVAMWVAGLVTLGAVLYFGGPLASRPLARLVPAAAEKKLGTLMLQTLVRDDELTAAQPLLAPLMHTLGADDVRVHLVQERVRNAFAVSGGDVVLYCGLLDALHSPDELAGVLAHEAAHVALHHSTEVLIRVFGTSIVMSAVVGDFSGLAGAALQSADSLLHLANSRANENEADLAGLATLRRAGVATEGFSDFFYAYGERRRGQSASHFLVDASERPITRARRKRSVACADATGDERRRLGRPARLVSVVPAQVQRAG